MTNLKQRVHEINRLFEATNLIAKQIHNELKPFVGKKIILQDGSLSKRLKDGVRYWLPDIDPVYEGQYAKVVNRIISRSGPHLVVQVKVCFSDEKYTHYHDTYMILGRMADGNKDILARLVELPLKEPIDYALEKHHIEHFKELQDKMDRVYKSIHPKLRRNLRR